MQRIHMTESIESGEFVRLIQGDLEDLEKWAGYLNVAGISNDIRMSSGSPGS